MGPRAGVAALRTVTAGLSACLVLGLPAPGGAQEVPPGAAQDTAAGPPSAADTVPSDTTPILPELPLPETWLVARWDRGELLLSSALTLGELLASVPELYAVRFGFLEGSSALTCCGAGPAVVEYTVDGYPVAPLGAGALEPLALPLAELAGVAVRRTAGGFRVDLTTRRLRGRTPYSTIEGGTGDYDVTVLRALFLAPFATGAVGFGFDRVETGGFAGLGGMERLGLWLSYARRLPWGFAGAVQWRRSNVSRGSLEAPERSDLVAHLRRAFGARWTVDLSAAKATTKIDSVPGGPAPERNPEAHVVALQAAWSAPRAEAALRIETWNGDAVPDVAASLEAAVQPTPWLAAGGDARRSRWGARDFDEGAARLRIHPHRAVSLGLDVEAGTRRITGLDALPPVTYRRVAASAAARIAGLELEAMVGRSRATPSPALGFEFDRDAAPLPGGDVTVGSVRGSAPTPIRPLRVVGSYERRGTGEFLYWPVDRVAVGGLFHDTYLGGQLEVRGEFRVLVRGPMSSLTVETTPASLVTLPRRLGSAGELVARVKDVRVFFFFEGFSDPVESADVGGAPLPPSRTLFGLKWEFWN